MDEFETAFGPACREVALVATGGHGRGELCPGSDLDLLLIHDGSLDEDQAGRFWYPIWDSGLHVGHGVRTVDQSLRLARDDLEVATSLLDVRPLAGDLALAHALLDLARRQWDTDIDRWITKLAATVTQRHESAGEVAFALEPDLKEGRGGLRDVHAMHWVITKIRSGSPIDLVAAYRRLLDARVELQRATGERTNVLRLQDQDAVAAALGHDDADELMAAVARSGREIAWASDELWFDLERRSRRRRFRRQNDAVPLGDGLSAVEGRIVLDPATNQDDPLLPLRVGVAAARSGLRLAENTLEAVNTAPRLGDPWPDGARELMVELLMAGSIEAIEALDHAEAWVRILPEWAPNRNRPQRNAYHRFTVDRHLLETVRNAAARTDSVQRPDLLVVGALFHDIGKGYPGDHAVVGITLARAAATRMGFDDDDVDTLAMMVEHHLLLPDVATRRDLDDPATIASVAATVGSIERLELLAALTESDSLATGPAAWSAWKEGLVHDLVIRVAHVILGGALRDVTTRADPSSEAEALLDDARELGGPLFRLVEDRILIACPDRPGLFSRIAGVLSLNGLDVLEATVHSEAGYALDEFRVANRFGGEIRVARIRDDLDRALTGRLALPARLAEKARAYPRRQISARPMRPDVRVINDASDDASVIEVIGPDHLGLLYHLTWALTDLQLDIRSAKVSTIGADAVDAFYVTGRGRDSTRTKVSSEQVDEIRAALLHALES